MVRTAYAACLCLELDRLCRTTSSACIGILAFATVWVCPACDTATCCHLQPCGDHIAAIAPILCRPCACRQNDLVAALIEAARRIAREDVLL